MINDTILKTLQSRLSKILLSHKDDLISAEDALQLIEAEVITSVLFRIMADAADSMKAEQEMAEKVMNPQPSAN